MTWADRVQRRWRNLAIRDKGLIVVAIPSLPLLLTSALIYANQREADKAERWVAHTLQVKTDLAQTLTLLVDAELSARGYVMTHSPEPLAAYQAASAALPQSLRRLAELVADNPQQIARLQRLPAIAEGRPLGSIVEYADKTPLGAPPPA